MIHRNDCEFILALLGFAIIFSALILLITFMEHLNYFMGIILVFVCIAHIRFIYDNRISKLNQLWLLYCLLRMRKMPPPQSIAWSVMSGMCFLCAADNYMTYRNADIDDKYISEKLLQFLLRWWELRVASQRWWQTVFNY